MGGRELKALLAGLLAGAVGLTVAPAAGAVSIEVTTTADEYGENPAACSLREAITSANGDVSFGGCAAGAGADTIRMPAGVYRITRAGSGEDGNSTGDFDLASAAETTIEPAAGSARVVIDGNGLDRVLQTHGAAPVTLRDLRVTGGDLGDQVTDGGGILVTVAPLIAERVTVDGNRSKYQGGGIAVYSGLQMANSTISGNTSGQYGGGLYVAGASSATVRSSTITANTAGAGGGGHEGGGIADAMSVAINFHNVINAGNRNDADPDGPADDCSTSPFYFPRYVIQTQPIGPSPCLAGFDPGTNQVADPRLGPLAYNGGQTPTHALRAGSPAIGAGGSAAPDECPPLDQNGRARPAGACDIGAVQYFVKPGPKPLPPVKRPTRQIATFDGKRLHILLKCPARFRPRCISRVVPLTRRRGGVPMAPPKRVVTRSNRWKRVSLVVRPAFRPAVQKMTTINRKRLVTRQVIRSRRVGKRQMKRPARVFHIYKVRQRG